MCFGGGQQTNNVQSPAYKPEDAYTAVEATQSQATGKTPGGDGKQETTQPDGTVKPGNVGLKM